MSKQDNFYYKQLKTNTVQNLTSDTSLLTEIQYLWTRWNTDVQLCKYRQCKFQLNLNFYVYLNRNYLFTTESMYSSRFNNITSLYFLFIGTNPNIWWLGFK